MTDLSELKQGTPEWLAVRVGRATASRAADVLATIKNGEAASRRQYRGELVCERLCGVPYPEGYKNAAMLHGIEQEPFAKIAYEAATGNVVRDVAFVQHPELMAGCSPDGEIGDDGLLEAKCPTTGEHIDTLLNGMSSKHVPQVQFQMWITGRKFVEFISYDPRMPERMQLYVQRVKRDEAYIVKLEAEVRKFLGEVDRAIAELEAKIA